MCFSVISFFYNASYMPARVVSYMVFISPRGNNLIALHSHVDYNAHFARVFFILIQMDADCDPLLRPVAVPQCNVMLYVVSGTLQKRTGGKVRAANLQA